MSEMSGNSLFDERRQKSFEFALDATKQLIALSTGIIAFMVTFSKDFIAVASYAKVCAVVAWVFLFLSVISGILSIFAMSGQLDMGDSKTNETHRPSFWEMPVGIWMIAQQVFFVLGVLLTIIFGYVSLTAQPLPQEIPCLPQDIAL